MTQGHCFHRFTRDCLDSSNFVPLLSEWVTNSLSCSWSCCYDSYHISVWYFLKEIYCEVLIRVLTVLFPDSFTILIWLHFSLPSHFFAFFLGWGWFGDGFLLLVSFSLLKEKEKSFVYILTLICFILEDWLMKYLLFQVIKGVEA